jgi:hypothetical protein
VGLQEFLVQHYCLHWCCGLQGIIADIMGAGWAVKVVRENERISDQVIVMAFTSFKGFQDLQHVFDKVDSNKDLHVNRMVGMMLCCLWTCVLHPGAAAGPKVPLQAIRHRCETGGC